MSEPAEWYSNRLLRYLNDVHRDLEGDDGGWNEMSEGYRFALHHAREMHIERFCFCDCDEPHAAQRKSGQWVCEECGVPFRDSDGELVEGWDDRTENAPERTPPEESGAEEETDETDGCPVCGEPYDRAGFGKPYEDISTDARHFVRICYSKTAPKGHFENELYFRYPHTDTDLANSGESEGDE